MPILIILWVLCGIAAGMIAQAKGRSFGAFFVCGLLLGVIGLIIALCARREQPANPPGWYPDIQDPRYEWYWDGSHVAEHPRMRP